MLRQYKLKDYDFKLIICVVALSVVGILAIGSAKNDLMSRQILGMGAGVFFMLLLSFIDYSLILYFYWILYFANIILLLIVTFFGININGAQRWVNILGIQFQPSESAKILLILFFAQFIMKNRERLNTVKFMAMAAFLLSVPLFLVYKQPNLSTSIVIVVVFCSLLFVGGLSYKIVLGVLAVIVPIVTIIFVIVLQPGQQLIEPYQAGRILSWIQPDKYADTTAYQQLNSITAIGSGQLWGKGLNNNEIASVKNGNFISEPQNDFIFAVIGEELGFVGAIACIILVLFIILECINIARQSKDLAGSIIACGMASLIGFQSFVNMAVATGIAPTTGIPFPFVSYGLTSLMSLYAGIGVVLNIRLQSKKY
ncbi:MAG: rod shape-determining protein RodA [Lachnospiraceae bacterium]|nr:rod shape-determining protein RodA [Lachnospiraceae bacterium]